MQKPIVDFFAATRYWIAPTELVSVEDKVAVADKRQLAMRTGYVESAIAPDILRSPTYVCSAACFDRTHKM